MTTADNDKTPTNESPDLETIRAELAEYDIYDDPLFRRLIESLFAEIERRQQSGAKCTCCPVHKRSCSKAVPVCMSFWCQQAMGHAGPCTKAPWNR